MSVMADRRNSLKVQYIEDHVQLLYHLWNETFKDWVFLELPFVQVIGIRFIENSDGVWLADLSVP